MQQLVPWRHRLLRGTWDFFFYFVLIIILRNSNSYPFLLGFQVHHRFADQLQNVENTSDVSVLSLQVAPAADAFADSADGQVSSPETLREYDFTIESRLFFSSFSVFLGQASILIWTSVCVSYEPQAHEHLTRLGAGFGV